MAWASCPVWIDDKLSTETFTLEDTRCKNPNVKAVNHRGYHEAPENTLSAFRLSKKKGFTYVECDVSFTSDGYAVLLYDSTVDRTSNGTGSINALTLAEVRALDFGSWKSEEYAGEQIPRFEEFIALCKHLGLHPYIELKEGTEEQIKGLVGVVKRYGMKGKVTWISFNSAYLGYIKAVDPNARLGFVVGAVSATTINTVTKTLQSGYNEVFIDCAYGNIPEEAVQLCADADIPLEVWTVNSEGEILALDAYVSGVTSDNLIAGKVFYDSKIGG
jgi:glycerophosphoryl diester phosphodiesterase